MLQIAERLHEALPLVRLAAQAQRSAAHWHRLFTRSVGETPRQYVERLRLIRAAALLLAHRDSVRAIAWRCGFRSHEVFCRVFRQHFGQSPREYRRRGWAVCISARQASTHLRWVQQIAPCLHLYHWQDADVRGRRTMAYSIMERELAAQPVLVIRRRVERAQLAATLGPLFGSIVEVAQRSGAALTGPPFTRFLAWGAGLLTIEAGLPVAAAVPGSAEVQAQTLPAGRVATTTHVGPYDQLLDAYAAMERWIEAQGRTSAGAPWEVYVTDPAAHPDPRTWRTELFWPIGLAVSAT
jgi:AraC family transcriptional regulator